MACTTGTSRALALEGAVHVRRHGHDEAAHERLDALVSNEIDGRRGARRGAALVVGDEQLDLPSEYPAGRIDLRDRQLEAEPHLPVVGLNQLVLSLSVPVRDERADAQEPGLDEGRERGCGDRDARSGTRDNPGRRASLDG